MRLYTPGFVGGWMLTERLSLLKASPTVSPLSLPSSPPPPPVPVAMVGSLLDWGRAVLAAGKCHLRERRRSISFSLRSNWVRPEG